MSGKWIAVAAVNGLIAVAAGAYAAHGMKVSAGVYPAEWTETASRYQMWHALALLSVALIWREMTAQPWLKAAAWGFLIGIVLFCGSLYLMALTDFRALAWVTPFGGAAFLIGWAALAVHGLRR
jgi:uncharacterized membrane protein YgdD (TMEM256/DUF423 family)